MMNNTETITIYHRPDKTRFKYEAWLEVNGWSLSASDILIEQGK